MRTEIKARLGQEEERPFLGLALSKLLGIGASIVIALVIPFGLFFFLPLFIKGFLSVVLFVAALYVALKRMHGMSGPQYLWVSYKYRRKQKVYLYKLDRTCELADIDWR